MPLPDETSFIEFKDGVPLNLKKKHQRLNGNQRGID
jgi:hypothetical protein